MYENVDIQISARDTFLTQSLLGMMKDKAMENLNYIFIIKKKKKLFIYPRILRKIK